MRNDGDTVYVYGVSSSADFDRASASGVEDAEIRTIEHDGLVALTSRLQGDELTARDLRAHWRVLECAFEDATVLPVRFGTVMDSEESVREQLLEANHDWLTERLAEVSGRAQLNLTGRYDEDALLREIVRASPAIARLRERLASGATPAEQLRLGQMVEAEIARRRAEDTALMLDVLEGLAVAARADEVAHPTAFKLAFLVERAAQDRFSGAVGAVRKRLDPRIQLRYVGPLPPFSFVQADVTSGSAAWA
jgi:Gas vesicle synthesis protein GvpL/GvpF